MTVAITRGAKDTGVIRITADASWWLFCLLIIGLNFLLLAMDPLPKVYLGDSQSYLWTALSGWIPPDRSFLYGYVIRWSSLGTQSLTSLLILQTFLGAFTAISVAFICRWIFELTSLWSYFFGFLCSVDPLQLVWQRYVLTETISLFFYGLTLLFAFVYLRQRSIWQLVIVQALSVLVISFRMSYLLVIQMSAFLLPLIAFFPEFRAAFRKHSSMQSRISVARLTGLHLAVSIFFAFVLLQGYQQVNGRLAGREPAYLQQTGLRMLAIWAPALKPSDSPDPRLAKIIADGGKFELNNPKARNGQLHAPGYLIDRWRQIEPNRAVQDQVAKQTALHALLHRPMNVARLGIDTFLSYWDFSLFHRLTKADLTTAFPWEPAMANYAEHFHLSPPRPEDVKAYTLLQRYNVRAQPNCYVVLVSPLICAGLLFFVSQSYVFLLCVHSWILLTTITLLSVVPSARYLQPMSLLTILIFAALVKAFTDRRWRSTRLESPVLSEMGEYHGN